MFHHWRIIKTGTNPRKPWQLQSKAFLPDGYVSQWERVSDYPSRKAAISVGMIMRDRGEPISWQGGAVRIGIARVNSCHLDNAETSA